jgi:tRNA threonylcarbamoyladenosine biosynthesis protein TsaE
MEANHHVIPPLAYAGHLPMTESELIAWGESLGRDIHPPLLVTLTGELGTGKTTLVQAICRGYGVVDDVTSPTYALVHEYTAPSKAPVYHIDLYRLEHEDELTNIGWDDLIAAHALLLVEWPERAGKRLPKDHLPITLDYLPNDPARRLLLAG